MKLCSIFDGNFVLSFGVFGCFYEHGSSEHSYTCSQYIYIKGTLDYMFRSEITYSKGMYIFHFLR